MRDFALSLGNDYGGLPKDPGMITMSRLMHGLICDRCSANLLIDSDVRYLVKIEVYAAYDPLELSATDMERNIEGEMAVLLESMKTMDPKELENQVYRRFSFDLCPSCQKGFLADPLGRGVEGGDAESAAEKETPE